ncbi:RNase A-like domain-containing protein [Streptomyces sp. NRRL WC-3549]|uniref:RNase A-like domain-containing protein n=1 Tax=Streptomyces sp. NRRL WC-3549 TaxID=1463925 RepID=UPI0004CA9C5F|nr:RNase A-like domain-containing protein [Streptomyces sp. NRRL WC-3549]
MLTRSASCPDRGTAQWATQQVVTANEQAIHRWLAQNTRVRLTIEAAWPSREEPVGRVQLEGDLLAGRGPVDVRAARVVLRREPVSPHGFVVHTTVPFYL